MLSNKFYEEVENFLVEDESRNLSPEIPYEAEEAYEELSQKEREEEIDSLIANEVIDPRCKQCRRHCSFSLRKLKREIGGKWTDLGFSTINRYLPLSTTEGDIAFRDDKDHRDGFYPDDPENFWYGRGARPESKRTKKCVNYLSPKPDEEIKKLVKRKEVSHLEKAEKAYEKFYNDLKVKKTNVEGVRLAFKSAYILFPYKGAGKFRVSPKGKVLMAKKLIRYAKEGAMLNELIEVLGKHKMAFGAIGQTVLYLLRTEASYRVNGENPVSRHWRLMARKEVPFSKMAKNKDGTSLPFDSSQYAWDKPDWRDEKSLRRASWREENPTLLQRRFLDFFDIKKEVYGVK